MIRVLQVVNDMHRAGLETMLMNYYRNIDRTKVQFDFLTHRPEKSDYDDEIISLGGRVYYAPRLFPHNYPKYFDYMKMFFKEHPEYQIMHSHIDSMSYIPLLTGKKARVPIRIAHSHNTAIDKDLKYILKQYFRFQITSAANIYYACGNEAGKFLFDHKDFKVIPNAVEATRFYFNSDVREKMRSGLGITNQFVVGHVGRISHQKNHKFLIEIFQAIQEKHSDSLLLLIGVGEKEKEVRDQVKALGITDKVKFLGNRSDVNKLYQAMDVFLLPSLFEGIPVVGVEAQFADLPCFFSDKVPREVKFSEKCSFIGLADTADRWADTILQVKENSIKRTSNRTNLTNSYYDIKKAKGILEDCYLSFYTK